MSGPAPVVLDDLAHPRFSSEIVQLQAGMAAMAPACPLEPEALCRAAAEQTGLADFGDDAFRHRLALLCHALAFYGERVGVGVRPRGAPRPVGRTLGAGPWSPS